MASSRSSTRGNSHSSLGSHRVEPGHPVAVIGLGRFGISVARELSAHGVEVLGIDCDARRVEECSEFLAESAVADSTDIQALEQLAVPEYQRVIVGIGSNLEASIVTALNVVDMGIPEIWAKADSEAHARILSQVGIEHVIRPEKDTGRRVAHLLRGGYRDFVEFDDHYSMIRMTTPPLLYEAASHGTSPYEMVQKLWATRALHIVSVLRDGQWIPVQEGITFHEGEDIIVAGSPEKVEKLYS